MLDTTDAPLPITLPISASDRHQADDFASQQPNATKAEQVYRNTLAILATQKYLQLLGIETALQDSHSWHPLHRVLSNAADLVISMDPDCPQYLDCRPVQAGDRTCFIPEAVWNPDLEMDGPSLMGHVIVQLDAPYEAAHLLGFAKAVSTSAVPLKTLQPLTDLVDEFLEPESPVTSETTQHQSSRKDINDLVIRLSNGLDDAIAQGWQQLTTALAEQWSMLQGNTPILVRDMRSVTTSTAIPARLRQRIEDLYHQDFPTAKSPHHHADALLQLMQTTQSDETRWQAAELLWSIDPQHPQSPVMTLKDLGVYLNQQTVALMVGMLPKEDGTFLILVRVCPLVGTQILPAGIMLMGCDDKGDEFFGVEARQSDQYIQFKFTAKRGERFNLQVLLNGSQFKESFMV